MTMDEIINGDAFREINFRFDDDIPIATTNANQINPHNGHNGNGNHNNTEVVIHRKKRPPVPLATTREEEDFRRNCREMNTSTPKKVQSDVKMAINEARSSFFGIDPAPERHRDSQMDTADMLDSNCTSDSAASRITASETTAEEDNCDINNNSSNKNQSKTKSESGLGSISDGAAAISDEPDGKGSAERELLLENEEGSRMECKPIAAPRNIIREPQYYPNPTQTVYLSTTVPQNIKGNKIMGRHTPTRSSLRHSRMLVISKDLRGALNPLNIFYPKVATLFLILHLLMGLLVTAIGLWFLLWAPSTRIQDNPYWSGLILILCGSMGIVVMEFKRIPRNLSRERCFNWLRINLLMVLFLTLIITFAAFLFAAVHALRLFAMNTVCVPASLFSKSPSCVCIFNKPIVNTAELQVDQQLSHNDTNVMEEASRIFLNVETESQFHYKDLNCNEVTGAFSLILLGSSLANLIGFVATLGFLLLYFHGTRQVNLYATVRQPAAAATSPPPPATTTGSSITTTIH